MTDKGRRQFIRGASALGAGSLLPAMISCDEQAPGAAHGGDGLFPASVTSGNDVEVEGPLQVIAGQVPADIYGHAFIMESLNTPEMVNLAAGRGAVSRVDFAPGGARIKRKMLRTPSVVVKEALDGTDHAFRERAGLFYIHGDLGVNNYCNTAFTRLADGAMAINCDAGIPHLLDPVSLDVISPIGGIGEWNRALPPVLDAMLSRNWPFPLIRSSAHPCFDEFSGEYITVDFTMGLKTGLIGAVEGSLYVKTWDLQGAVKSTRVITPEGRAATISGAVHTLCVTRNFIIILDTPFGIELLGMLGLGNQPVAFKEDTTMWVIRRDELEQGDTVLGRPVTVPKEYQHVVANFDDYGDEVTLYAASSPCTDFSEALQTDDLLLDGSPIRPELRGMLSAPMDEGEMVRLRLRVQGEQASVITGDTVMTMEPDLGWEIALQAYKGNNASPEELTHMYWVSFGFHHDLAVQRVRDAYADYPYRNVPLDQLPSRTIGPALFGLNCRTMTIDTVWRAPEGWFVASPQFIPTRGSQAQNEGYLLVTAISDGGDELWLFDAARLEKGPVCRLGHPAVDLAFSLHTTWSPDLPGSKLGYRMPASSDLQGVMADKPQVLKDVFAKEVYPRFG